MRKMVRALILSAAVGLMFVGGAQAAHVSGTNDTGVWAASFVQSTFTYTDFSQPLGAGGGTIGSDQTYTVNKDFGIPINPPQMNVNATVATTVGTSGTMTVPNFGYVIPSWNDNVIGTTKTTFSFSPAVPGAPWTTKAIAGDFYLYDQYVGSGDQTTGGGLKFTFNFVDSTIPAESYLFSTYLASPTDLFAFVGWTSDVSISMLTIESANLATQDFSIQNLSYNQVPEPSTFILLGAGVAGLLIRRRRK